MGKNTYREWEIESEDPSIDEERAERRRMDAEVDRGRADADRFKFNRDTFGEDYAAAEELAWELKDPDPAY